MKAKCSNWVGVRIGHLTVQEATEERKNGYTVWRCRCTCGNEILLDTRTLQRETIQDCGCITKVKPGQKDMTGMRFGKLVCLYPEEDMKKEGSGVIWHCRCDCGNECSVSQAQMTRGYAKSCGCLSHPPLKDYVGRRFGRLTVESYAGKRKGMHYWHCRCDCGNSCDAGQTPLQNGETDSCGCLREERRRETMKMTGGTSIRILEDTLTDRLIATNTSGRTGVYWEPGIQKWRAKIEFKRKSYDLGSYRRKEDAIKARERGEVMFWECIDEYYASLREEQDKIVDAG